MKIGPLDNSGRPAGPPDENRRPTPVQPESRKKTDETDSVDISESARSMSEQEASERTHDTTSADNTESSRETSEMDERADKIEQARQRIESGYYDRPDVKAEIARRIADDFAG
jgi:anti-sigma28 factor (negative regulator of flagellin synthesis)